VGAVDPRLLRRARPVRTLLALDTLLGAAAVALVIAQATLLAAVVARAFDGRDVSAVRAGLVALALVFAARGALAWAMEIAGRRAASSVLSELRLALAERRLRAQPVATDGTEAGEIAAAAVDGIGALEGYFARYLPQMVLACLAPVVVLAWVA